MLSQTADNQAAIPLGSSSVTVDPNSTGMYCGSLISLLFNPSIASPPVGQIIGASISVYYQLTTNGTTLNFFDDPELEVDCGTGGGAMTATAGA